MTTGGFSLGDAVLRFLVASAGGLVCGVLTAIAVRLLLSAVRDPLLVNCISLATPLAAYLFGEELHVSGVLAVAVAGLMIGHDSPASPRAPAACRPPPSGTWSISSSRALCSCWSASRSRPSSAA